MIIYEFDDYRQALKEILLEKKSTIGTAFTFQSMAKACRIQKTYLSKVLNDRGHLNCDQLYLACDYLGLNTDDRDYLFLIFDESRTVVQKRKQELQAQIQCYRKNYVKTEAHLEAHSLPAHDSDFSEYYLNPYLQIVHMFLTVDRFARNVSKIGDKLHLDAEYLANVLRKLQQLGIIDMVDAKYKVVKDNIHLSKDSPLYSPYRNLLRMKSTEWIDKLPTDKTYNFSGIFSTTPQTKQKIQIAFLDFLKSVQEMVEVGKEEEVFQMNFDLFGWSD